MRRPHATQITTSVLAQTAFRDYLYLVCSVHRPFNDGKLNSRPIIIPTPPLPQATLQQTYCCNYSWQHNALQTGFICGKRSDYVTQVLPECTDVQYVPPIFSLQLTCTGIQLSGWKAIKQTPAMQILNLFANKFKCTKAFGTRLLQEKHCDSLIVKVLNMEERRGKKTKNWRQSNMTEVI